MISKGPSTLWERQGRFREYKRRLSRCRRECRIRTRSSTSRAIHNGPTRRTDLTRPSYASYEIQLLDDAGKPANNHGTGSLYRYLAPTANVVRPAPEWNTIEVECVGPRIRITINGLQVVDADQTTIADTKEKPAAAPAPKDKPLEGYVCLQSHSGRVEFRKVQIRDIGKDEK